MTTAPSTPTRSLLTRVLTAIAALMPARRGRAGAAPAAATFASQAQWARLAQAATRFFDARGLAPEHPGAPWPEAGARLLHKGQRRYLVHAAHWQAPRVDAATVQAVIRAVARHQATAGILLCAGDVFTPAARALARENAILLLDPRQLQPPQRAGDGAAAPAAKPAPSASRAGPASTLAAPLTLPPAPAPAPAAPRRPVLRPDHQVRGRRDFMPTVPIAPSELAAPRCAS